MKIENLKISRRIRKRRKATLKMPEILKDKRTIASAAIALSTIGACAIVNKNDSKTKDKNQMYLMGLSDRRFELLDKDGSKVPLEIDCTDEMYVATIECDYKDDSIYEVVLCNQNGELQEGYLKGKDLEDTIVFDTEVISKEFCENLEVDVVSPKDGCWLRKEKTIDKNSSEAILLENGNNVLTNSTYYKVDDNEYAWKKVVRIDTINKKINTWYMVDGYIMNKNFEDAVGERYSVSVSDIGLNVRSSASTAEDNVIAKLQAGEEVVLVPNIAAISSDNINWFYIGYKDEYGNINFGYCASSIDLGNGDEYSYLIKSDKKENSNDLGMQIFKQVSLDGLSKGTTLKLRKEPGTDSKIEYELGNDYKIYTYENYLNNTIYKDGYTWLKVFLIDGTEGYVAAEYLKDIEKENQDVIITSEGENLNFISGKMKGYFGLDVNNIVSTNAFETLASKAYNYYDDYPSMNSNKKIDFAIIKIGATGWGTLNENMCFVEEPNNNVELVNICEKNNIPYGLYYYSQCITMAEAEQEADRICSLINELDINSKQYNILPIYIDVECYGYADGQSLPGRVCVNAMNNSKSAQTSVVNYLMNLVREKTGLEVCLYTDNNTLDTTLNFSEFDEINKKNCWIVEVSEIHSNNLMNNHSEVYQYSKIRQSDVDRILPLEDNSVISVDYDVIDSEYFKSLLKKKVL